MECIEVRKGFGDIVPADYTYEVQNIYTSALTNIGGKFTLTMEGYTTNEIDIDATSTEVKQTLEGIPTIFVASVSKFVLDVNRTLNMWEVTFAHMHNEVVQGAGDIPPFVATDVSLTPTYSAAVHVFEKVKGTHPYSISLNNLMTNVDYYVRVTAHNERGYSLTSSVSTARTYGKPSAPLPPTMGIQSGTSLDVQWNLPPTDGTIDEFVVERYSEVPTYEIQVITSSSSYTYGESFSLHLTDKKKHAIPFASNAYVKS